MPDRLGTTHTKDTFFAGLFARLKPKIEAQGAAWAVADRIAKVVWLLLHEGVEYQQKGVAQPILGRWFAISMADARTHPRGAGR